jgi:hypothetical protein
MGEDMKKKRWRLAIGAAVLAVVALTVGLSLALTGGGSKQLSHSDFQRIWAETHLGDPMSAVLARWPKIPYQHYSDNLKDDCYEFLDVPDVTRNNMPQNIYNLCFKDGVLRSKAIL